MGDVKTYESDHYYLVVDSRPGIFRPMDILNRMESLRKEGFRTCGITTAANVNWFFFEKIESEVTENKHEPT